MPPAASVAVALIGYGAIGRAVADAISEGSAGDTRLTRVLVRSAARHRNAPHAQLVTENFDALLASHPQVVVEAAGQDVLRAFGPPVLDQGIDLLVTSIGAFTDESFFNDLQGRAQRSGARLQLCSGALPAVDWMFAVSRCSDVRACITQSKPVSSWRATPAAELVDLDALREPTRFFEGTAREAASRFPRSSNITAMLALCAGGLDNTRVSLIADPVNATMTTEIVFDSPVGSLRIEWQGVPSARNVSTSADVPLTVIHCLTRMSESVIYG